jgi:hypothetical protein
MARHLDWVTDDRGGGESPRARRCTLEFILPLLIAKVHAGKSSAMPVCKRMNLPPTFRNAGLPQEDAGRRRKKDSLRYHTLHPTSPQHPASSLHHWIALETQGSKRTAQFRVFRYRELKDVRMIEVVSVGEDDVLEPGSRRALTFTRRVYESDGC